MKKKSFCLIKGRHQIKNVSEFIFDDSINDVTDIDSTMETVQDKLRGANEVDLFVTGLTVALVSVMNFCSLHHIKLTLHHFDRETNGWFVQEVFTDIHKKDLKESLLSLPKNIEKGPFTNPPNAMDKEFIVNHESALDNYRNYYSKGKRKFMKYTKRKSEPSWLKNK